MKINVTPLMSAIERYIAKADDDLEEKLSDEGYVNAAGAVKAINELEDSVRDALEEDAESLLENLKEYDDIESFMEDAWSSISTSEELKDVLRKLFRKKFDEMLRQFTYEWILSDAPDYAPAIDDERITKPAEQFIKDWSQQLADIMNLTTKDSIERILLDAQEKGWSIDDTAKAISDSGIRQPGYRSRRVALTEVLRIESYAQQEAMVQNPLAYAKKWKHVLSSNPRENHMAINGQQVFKRETFTLTGADGTTYRPLCPRDTSLPASESVNCHCLMEMVADESALGMSKEDWIEARKKAMDEVDAEWESKMAAEEEEKIKWPEKGQKISTEQFKELMKYAKEKEVQLSGFKQYDGDINTIKELVDDVNEIAKDYPLIKEGKKSITVYLDESIDSNDFAITRNHIVCINADAYRDVSRLAEEYEKLVAEGWFVKGTDYRSIIRHEIGHVVENKYKFNGLEAVKKVMDTKDDDTALVYVSENLSQYAYRVDREIISECFSGAYSSGEKNEFALKILASFDIIKQRGGDYNESTYTRRKKGYVLALE